MKRRLSVVALAACCVGVAIALLLCAKPIAVAYHERAMKHALEKALEVGPGDSHQSDFIQAYEDHRDALVRWEFFERREFPLTTIEVPSLESKRLWQELQATFPDHPHAEMHGYTPGEPNMIVVWGRAPGS